MDDFGRSNVYLLSNKLIRQFNLSLTSLNLPDQVGVHEETRAYRYDGITMTLARPVGEQAVTNSCTQFGSCKL